MIEMSAKEQTISVPYNEFVDLIRSKEKLENIKTLFERCNYPVDEVKAVLGIEVKKKDEV